jgi:outer membrane biosynthesis protein TonB
VHVAVLGGLLALAHPRFRSAPTMRVALVGHTGSTAGPGRTEESAGGSGASPAPHAPLAAVLPPPPADPAAVRPTRPPAPHSTSHPARSTQTRSSVAEESGDAASGGAEALVTAVQSDVWMLSGSSPPVRGAARPGQGTAGAPAPVGASAPVVASGAAGAGSGQAAASGTGTAGTGPGNEVSGEQSSASLLGALSQRLAWSAARCAPAEVVRTTRHAIPGVPLHFCLDAAGRPSDVGLLGTTGSDLLDRAARDCVVPGALPLPAVPGCYTVEVRFPTRG